MMSTWPENYGDSNAEIKKSFVTAFLAIKNGWFQFQIEKYLNSKFSRQENPVPRMYPIYVRRSYVYLWLVDFKIINMYAVLVDFKIINMYAVLVDFKIINMYALLSPKLT
jgi:hypothetical protein